MTTRSVRPSAQKRSKVSTQIDSAQRAVRRILPGEAAGTAPYSLTEEVPIVPMAGTGIERPVPEWVETKQSLVRVFAFVDLSGFTKYTDQHGAHGALEVLTRFRSACRLTSGRRGTRVAKWLGDGVMLVGTDPGPLVATVGELMLRFADDPFELHAGIATGSVLLFEGDDYIGRPVNVAARLCDAAAPGELLAVGVEGHVPTWVDEVGQVTVEAAGIGTIHGVSQLNVSPDAWMIDPNVPHVPTPEPAS